MYIPCLDTPEENRAKSIVEAIYDRQVKKEYLTCPRCGENAMNPDDPCVNALSRRARVYICDDCGMVEAMRDAVGREPLPFTQWAAVEFGVREVGCNA